MVTNPRSCASLAAMLLAGCAATPSPGRNSPRDGAGQFVDPRPGTPLPGQTTGYDAM